MKSPAKPEPKARAVMGAPEPIAVQDDHQGDEAGTDSAGHSAGNPADTDASESDQVASEAKPRPKIRRDGEPRGKKRSGLEPNNVRKLRQEAMMSKAELARRAGVSPLTIDRVEAGAPCRMDTKRKILEALGLKPSARTEVWPDIDADIDDQS
jgi:DNA-binding XRE family transcriptional regulator